MRGPGREGVGPRLAAVPGDHERPLALEGLGELDSDLEAAVAGGLADLTDPEGLGGRAAAGRGDRRRLSRGEGQRAQRDEGREGDEGAEGAEGDDPRSAAPARPALAGLLQGCGQALHVGEAGLGVLLEAAEAEGFDLGVEPGRELARRDRARREDGLEDSDQAPGHEGRSPGQELVEDSAEAVDVHRDAQGAAVGLLGSHVGRGAHQGPGLGVAGLAVHGLGDPEVRQEGLARLAEEDVLGLEVAVEDLGGVDLDQGLGDRGQEARGLVSLQRARAPETFLEGAGREVHDQVGSSLVDTALVDLEHVGVLDPRRSLALELEASQRFGVEGGRDDLDRDLTPQLEVAGSIDRAHAASGQLAQEFVASKSLGLIHPGSVHPRDPAPQRIGP